MIKRLSILSGMAIIAVVINHSMLLGQQAMFLWTDRYLPVSVPNWDKLGSFTYYALLTIRQLCNFSVPAFFFVSGFFIAYAYRGAKNLFNRSALLARLKGLIIPYLIWSFIYFFGNFLLGDRLTPIEILGLLTSIGAPGPYWFIPLLCIFNILAIFIAPLSKNHWKQVLVITALIQISAMGIFYLSRLYENNSGLQFLIKLLPFWSPLHTIFFFTFGIVFGLHLQEIKDFLMPYRRILLITLPIFAFLNIAESDFLIRSSLNINVNAHYGTLTFNLYAFTFLLLYITLDDFPQINFLFWVGGKTYGIYLLHFIFLRTTSLLIYKYAPLILNNQVVLQAILLFAGLAIPMLLIFVVTKSPIRRYYRYLLG
jgi:probable poly-beta-1,6-N-acetyl-D-glucosamine export protein